MEVPLVPLLGSDKILVYRSYLNPTGVPGVLDSMATLVSRGLMFGCCLSTPLSSSRPLSITTNTITTTDYVCLLLSFSCLSWTKFGSSLLSSSSCAEGFAVPVEERLRSFKLRTPLMLKLVSVADHHYGKVLEDLFKLNAEIFKKKYHKDLSKHEELRPESSIAYHKLRRKKSFPLKKQKTKFGSSLLSSSSRAEG